MKNIYYLYTQRRFTWEEQSFSVWISVDYIFHGLGEVLASLNAHYCSYLQRRLKPTHGNCHCHALICFLLKGLVEIINVIYKKIGKLLQAR